MKFSALQIPGVFEVALDPHTDERGFFARAFCPAEFARAGLAFTPAQINLSRNAAALTLRGMHWQDAPFAEAKVVRCVRGRIFDVVADLRPDSPSYRKWIGRDLDAKDGLALFVPEGCAHGFLSLEDDCDVLYMMGRPHTAGQARGFRYDDPAFAIEWPSQPKIVAPADLAWPAWQEP